MNTRRYLDFFADLFFPERFAAFNHDPIYNWVFDQCNDELVPDPVKICISKEAGCEEGFEGKVDTVRVKR